MHEQSQFSIPESLAPHISSSIEPESKRPRTSIFIVIATAVTIAIFGGIGAYLSIVRIPNRDYESALTSLDAAFTNSEEISKIGTSLNTDNVEQRDAKLAIVTKEISEYEEHIGDFKESRVYKDDLQVKKAYDKEAELIEAYGTTTTSFLASFTAYMTLGNICTNSLQEFSEIVDANPNQMNRATFNTTLQDCRGYSNDHQTVSLQSLRPTYVSYREGLMQVVDIYEETVSCIEIDDPCYQQKQAELDVAGAKLRDQIKSANPSISNGVSPKAALKEVRGVLVSQQSNRNLFSR